MDRVTSLSAAPFALTRAAHKRPCVRHHLTRPKVPEAVWNEIDFEKLAQVERCRECG